MTNWKKAREEIRRAGIYRDLDIIGWETVEAAADALDWEEEEKP